MGAWFAARRARGGARGSDPCRGRSAPAASSARPGAFRGCDARSRRAGAARARGTGATGTWTARAVRLHRDNGHGVLILAEALAAYLSQLWAEPIVVENLSRIPGGASRETYSFDAMRAGGERKGLILRRDPVCSLIDTDRATEFLAYQSFASLVPVPEPVVLETGASALQRPFFIMSRVDGGSGASPCPVDPHGPHAAANEPRLFASLGLMPPARPL